MKLYFLAVIALAITLAQMMVFGPHLISSKNDTDVVLGFVSFAVYFPSMFFLLKPIVLFGVKKYKEIPK